MAAGILDRRNEDGPVVGQGRFFSGDGVFTLCSDAIRGLIEQANGGE